MQLDSKSDEFVNAALPVLSKYGLTDDPDENQKYGKEKLEHVFESIESNSTDKTFIFDAECIENDEDYSDLALQIIDFSGHKGKIKKIKSSVNFEKEKAGLAMLIGDTNEKRIWWQSNDWISDEFIQFLSEILEKHFDQKIVNLPSTDQCIRILVVDTEEHAAINDLINYYTHGDSPRELYAARLVSSIVACITGAIVSTFIGWYFLGFLWSLLASVGLWSIIGVILILKYAWRCAQEEEAEAEAEKLRTEDPEAFGRAVAAAFVEEAANREGNSEMGKRLKKVAELNQAQLKSDRGE